MSDLFNPNDLSIIPIDSPLHPDYNSLERNLMRSMGVSLYGSDPQPDTTPSTIADIFSRRADLRQDKKDLLGRFRDLSKERTRTSFVNPEANQKGFLDALKDPTEAQRNAFIAFGLGLAGSTGDLSQRLAAGLGQGVGALQKTREKEKARELQGMQFEMKELGLEGEALTQEFQQQQYLDTIARQARTDQLAQDKFLLQQDSPELKIIENIARLRAAGRNEEADDLRAILDKKGRFAPSTQTVYGPGGEVLYSTTTGDPSQVDPQSSDPVLSRRNQIAVDFKKQGYEVSESDVKFVDEARQKALVGTDSNRDLLRWADYLEGGMKTGTGSGVVTIKGRLAELARNLNIGQGEDGKGIPFLDDADALGALGDREAAISLTAKMGAERLELFGGNDSERELLVSLKMVPGVDKSVEGNRQIIKNNALASKILQERPGFMEDWIRENGSLTAKNKDGDGFNKKWSEFQLTEFRKGGGKVKEEDMDFFAADIDAFLKGENLAVSKATPDNLINDRVLQIIQSP